MAKSRPSCSTGKPPVSVSSLRYSCLIIVDCFSSQMAFVLNHQQHWFTLRRFGSLENPGSGHWFNLNSFLKEPEWVGKLYLGMVLSQAEDEGNYDITPQHKKFMTFQDTLFLLYCQLTKGWVRQEHCHVQKQTT